MLIDGAPRCQIQRKISIHFFEPFRDRIKRYSRTGSPITYILSKGADGYPPGQLVIGRKIECMPRHIGKSTSDRIGKELRFDQFAIEESIVGDEIPTARHMP